MDKEESRIPAYMALFIGISTVIGWVLENRILVSINPEWVTMKLVTALTICLMSIGVLLRGVGERLQIVRGMMGMWTIIIMLMGLLDALSDGGVGIFSLFGSESAVWAVNSEAPGEPSLLTIICSIALSVELMLYRGDSREDEGVSNRVLADFVMINGASVVIGYLLDLPLLYGRIEGLSGAAAIHTGVAFILLGAAVRNIRYFEDWRKGDGK